MSDYNTLSAILTARGVHYNVSDSPKGIKGRVIEVFTKGVDGTPLPLANFVFDYGQQRLQEVRPVEDEHLLTGKAYSELARLSALSPKELRNEAVRHRAESLESLKEWKRDKLIPFLFLLWVNGKTVGAKR